MIKDLLIAIPIGITYNVFVHYLSNVVFSDLEYAERYQKTLIMMFIIGISTIIISFTILKSNKRYRNRAIRYGLIFGSLLLIFYSMITNWANVLDETKLFIFGTLLLVMISYGYYLGEEKDDKNMEKI